MPSRAGATYRNCWGLGRSKIMNGGDGSMVATIALAFPVMDSKELAELQRMMFDSSLVRAEAVALPFKLADQAKTHLNLYPSHLLAEGPISV